MNAVDPDGRIIRLVVSGFKVARRTFKAKGNVVKGAADEVASIGDDLATFGDGVLDLNDAGAVVDLVVGTDFSNSKTRAASRAKRAAAREGKRRQNIPTSRQGEQVQSRPGEPRHQIVEGSDGRRNGVVDGSRDTVHDNPHVEVGPLKQGDELNRHGQPRLQQGEKIKVEQEIID